MGQVVLKLEKDILQQMNDFYANNQQKNKSPHTLFVAKKDGCTITAYLSGKVLFQGSNIEHEVVRWEKYNLDQHEQKKQPSLPFLTEAHAGSDEAGTGDYFGPITVASVYANKKDQALLKELGVKDSKTLTDASIKNIVKDILHTNIVYSSVHLNNEKYNELVKKGWSQNRMKAWMHHHAIKNVINKLGEKPHILVDQFSKPEQFHENVRKSGEEPIEGIAFLTKAESVSIPVACASMIARYRFLQEMDRLSEIAGFELQKGASHIVDQQIKRLIETKGFNVLNQIAKVHFANTKKAMQL